MEIETDFIYSSDIEKNCSLKSQDKIVDICKILDASKYVNPIGGVELYSKKQFEKNGIELNFLQTDLIKYQQFNNRFVSNLSIIDILMFNSVSEIKEMLQYYNLK